MNATERELLSKMHRALSDAPILAYEKGMSDAARAVIMKRVEDALKAYDAFKAQEEIELRRQLATPEEAVATRAKIPELLMEKLRVAESAFIPAPPEVDVQDPPDQLDKCSSGLCGHFRYDHNHPGSTKCTYPNCVCGGFRE